MVILRMMLDDALLIAPCAPPFALAHRAISDHTSWTNWLFSNLAHISSNYDSGLNNLALNDINLLRSWQHELGQG